MRLLPIGTDHGRYRAAQAERAPQRTVGIATTDANGRAQTPTLPAGRYWVLSDTKVGNKRMMWNEPVDLKAGDQSVVLDQSNAMPVE